MQNIDQTLYQIDCQYKSSMKTPEYYEITFVDAQGTVYVTYAVPGYENWHTWKNICDNPDHAVVVKNCSQKTRYRKPQFNKLEQPIIDCDSQIQVVDVVNMKAQLKALYEHFKGEQYAS